MVLIGSSSTHNSSHQCVSQETHRYIHVVYNFQNTIVNGHSKNCGGRCEMVRLKMGDYSLKTHMFSIKIYSCSIAMGVEWLWTLGPIAMDFCEVYMSFQ